MKILSIILILASLSECNAQNEIKTINSFINEIILKESDFSKTKTFIAYDKSISKNEMIHLFVKENIKAIKEHLMKSNLTYDLLTNEELRRKNIYFKFNTNYKKVYHLVSKKEVITTFIIDNDKIISFYYYIVKTKKQVRTPFLLNKPLVK